MITTATPETIPQLFADPPGSPILHYQRFDLDQARRQIDDTGFAIVKDLAPKHTVERIRDFWLKTFTTTKPAGRVTWAPYFGQENHIGYTSDPFQHLFRACDFLWNEPFNRDTRDVCIRVHALRNLILDEDPYLGMRFTDGRYGIFVTASYYPGGPGRMKMHDDGVAGRHRLLHSLVPVTFKGVDYKEGGMIVMNRRGETVDVDAMVEPGDVIFYDGALKHGVAPIQPFPGKMIGRIQVFPIPTDFNRLEENTRAMAKIPFSQFLSAKWFMFKNGLRIRMGFNPSTR